jgi:hypothetical protein
MVEEDDDWFWEEYARDEYCLWCCTQYHFKSSECPDCDCDAILDELIEGDPMDLLEECIDEFDCPLEDWGEEVEEV